MNSMQRRIEALIAEVCPEPVRKIPMSEWTQAEREEYFDYEVGTLICWMEGEINHYFPKTGDAFWGLNKPWADWPSRWSPEKKAEMAKRTYQELCAGVALYHAHQLLDPEIKAGVEAYEAQFADVDEHKAGVPKPISDILKTDWRYNHNEKWDEEHGLGRTPEQWADYRRRLHTGVFRALCKENPEFRAAHRKE